MGKSKDRREPKILLWDIEASDLAANFGFVFCIGYKWFGQGKTQVISIRDFPGFKRDVTNDRYVLREFQKVMEQADMQVTWYGSRFDLPFVQTRAMMGGLKPFARIPHVDAWRIARFQLKLNSNRLDTVSRAIPLGANENRKLKTPIDGQHWVKGKAGYTTALKYIESHCRADIEVLEEVYRTLRPYAPQTVPNLSKLDARLEEGCPKCGSDRIQSRGYSLTARGAHRKYQCRGCFGWFSLPTKIKIG